MFLRDRFLVCIWIVILWRNRAHSQYTDSEHFQEASKHQTWEWRHRSIVYREAPMNRYIWIIENNNCKFMNCLCYSFGYVFGVISEYTFNSNRNRGFGQWSIKYNYLVQFNLMWIRNLYDPIKQIAHKTFSFIILIFWNPFCFFFRFLAVPFTSNLRSISFSC